MTNFVNKAGYEVRYYDDYEHFKRCQLNKDNPKILHNSNSFGNKLSSGKIKQSTNLIWSFEFRISYAHQYYNDIRFINGIVEVINIFDNEREFIGRILKPTGEMSGSGAFSKTYICEDFLGYLHDSSQYFQRLTNTGLKRYLTNVIEVHNEQVEPHKRFRVGTVDIDSESDIPYRYIAYDDTFKTIKTYMLDRAGGYMTLEFNDIDNGLILNWTREIGTFVDSPIKLGQNIKTAKREIDPEGLITRLVPVGSDKDNSTGRDSETGQYVTRERVTIESANGGLRYLEDAELVKEFGIIQKSVDWTEISDPSILKKRGQQYLDNQKVAIASWSLDTVELYLIDPRFKKYKVGNTHPIDNPPLAGAEQLQIVEKEIDISKPQVVTLKIGSIGQSLSMYQLQQQEAKKSMQRQAENEAAARRKALDELESKQKEFETVQNALKSQIEKVDKETNKAALQTTLAQNEALLAGEKKNLEALKDERTRLENLGTNQEEMLNFVDLQISISETKISNYNALIEEINVKLNEITKK